MTSLLMCACTCVRVHAHAQLHGAPPQTPDRVPPTPPRKGGTPEISQKSIKI